MTLADGSFLLSVRVLWQGQHAPFPISIVAFHSTDGGYGWNFRGIVMNASLTPQSLEGLSENDLVMMADGASVMCVTRLDGGDGSRSRLTSYAKAISTDGGRSWSNASVLPDGVGSA